MSDLRIAIDSHIRMGLTAQLREYPVTLAQEEDLDTVLAIQEEHWIVPKLATEVTRDELAFGFLVHKLTRAELVRLLACPEAAVIVCKFDGAVVGYAIGYTLAHHLSIFPEYWPDTIQFIDRGDYERLGHGTSEKVWYYRQQAVARHFKRLGIATVLSNAVRWYALGRGCTSSIGEIVEAPYYNEASFGTLSSESKIVGRIPDLYEGVNYTWAVIETPLT